MQVQRVNKVYFGQKLHTVALAKRGEGLVIGEETVKPDGIICVLENEEKVSVYKLKNAFRGMVNTFVPGYSVTGITTFRDAEIPSIIVVLQSMADGSNRTLRAAIDNVQVFTEGGITRLFANVADACKNFKK